MNKHIKCNVNKYFRWINKVKYWEIISSRVESKNTRLGRRTIIKVIKWIAMAGSLLFLSRFFVNRDKQFSTIKWSQSRVYKTRLLPPTAINPSQLAIQSRFDFWTLYDNDETLIDYWNVRSIAHLSSFYWLNLHWTIFDVYWCLFCSFKMRTIYLRRRNGDVDGDKIIWNRASFIK